ncbi:MAG: methionine--tRNA ligase [Candidatus Moranbacteria bacterium RIFCSPHIGHO2_01_FULL_55_24]|nr:MAG: methionine--tRNA ligase [Candidatus Moranbacteria bacterium RIFCSPHIGHO2_01_FULL_55_24]
MPEQKPFLITTPIYYVNGRPHIGHAYTTVAADCIARYQKLLGRQVFFSTGTDEHGIKIQKKAEEEGKEPQAFVDEMAQAFRDLWDKLEIDYTRFIRTTESAHIAAVERVLQDLYDRGIIYQGTYEGLYCTGCEQFKTEDDLVDGKCPDHDRAPEPMKEESYLMKMTVIQQELQARIERDELCVTPEKYKAEILSFLGSETLEDVSISRKNVKWGIPLPFDPSHTTYVWIDAFLNYLTVLGWDGNRENVPEEWPADVHLIGKDILRVHATIWPALLMHLGLPTQKKLLVNGFILSGGRKMSKTLGNAISVEEVLERFGTDGTRYLLMSAGNFGDDVDLTMERMTETYNAHLANGIGNLVSRVVKLSEKLAAPFLPQKLEGFDPEFAELLDGQKLSDALQHIWARIAAANKYIDDEKPWELAKTDQGRFESVIQKLLTDIAVIAYALQPFLPATSEKIEKALREGKTEPLFQRI